MKYISISEIGLVRDENQDYLAVETKDNTVLALICDGIGGGNAGSLASKMTVQSMVESFRKQDHFESVHDISAWFGDAITRTNYEVFKKSLSHRKFEGMGTTLIALVLWNGFGVGFNIGDSRLYTFAKEKLTCLSEDQTYAHEMYLQKKISKEESLIHPKRNVLMNAVGIDKQVKYEQVEVGQEWEQILLSSDGLHSYVKHELIEETLRHHDLVEKKNRLREMAYEAGAYDNISFILIEGDLNE
ncbi:protein phosphatase 2C domain-containing protein [Erysipelothrix urinaevulpis]|uniref:protein phosphatase 2C domain-containing protein n=1 Tax=Erysipelothrix urinaevulpis TaxID=2683717 RepID=UPI001359A5FE|nr:protein phosphatase 2C domain-containing protein [Erysipelothrix urinaevulpis]